MNECRQCKVVKPWSNFHKNTKMKSGHINTCSDCFRKNRGHKPSTRRTGKDYISGKELYYELIVSKALGRLTRKAQMMFIKIADGVISKFSYNDPNDKYDCYTSGIEKMFKNYYHFNEDKSTNAFAYMTEICKRGIAQQWNSLNKNKDSVVLISIDGLNSGNGMFNL